MTPEPFPFLIYLLIGGGVLIGGVLAVRLLDQLSRDAGRVVVIIRWPRNLTDKQLLAVVRAILGLAPATTGLTGRASVALEVVGTRGRHHVPAAAPGQGECLLNCPTAGGGAGAGGGDRRGLQAGTVPQGDGAAPPD